MSEENTSSCPVVAERDSRESDNTTSSGNEDANKTDALSDFDVDNLALVKELFPGMPLLVSDHNIDTVK